MDEGVFRLELMYDGRRFRGYQLQSPESERKCRSIQGVMQEHLADLFGTKIICQGLSRTDSGVSALQQYAFMVIRSGTTWGEWCRDVALDAADEIRREMNERLPATIRVVNVERVLPVPLRTVSRLAVRKRYSYFIGIGDDDPALWPRMLCRHWRSNFQLDLLFEALSLMLGTHDFSALCSSRGTSAARRRVIRRIRQENDAAGERSGDVHEPFTEESLDSASTTRTVLGIRVVARVLPEDWQQLFTFEERRRSVAQAPDSLIGFSSSLEEGFTMPTAADTRTRLVVVTMESDGFLRHMVRKCINVAVKIAIGSLAIEKLSSILRNELDPPLSIGACSANPLWLDRIWLRESL